MEDGGLNPFPGEKDEIAFDEGGHPIVVSVNGELAKGRGAKRASLWLRGYPE